MSVMAPTNEEKAPLILGGLFSSVGVCGGALATETEDAAAMFITATPAVADVIEESNEV